MSGSIGDVLSKAGAVRIFTLSLHDALPIGVPASALGNVNDAPAIASSQKHLRRCFCALAIAGASLTLPSAEAGTPIGRASCRERVKILTAPALLKTSPMEPLIPKRCPAVQ